MRGITRKRLSATFYTTLLFTICGLAVAWALKMPMDLAVVGVFLIGFFVSSFEVFYFQASRGKWLREMHPIKLNLIYSLTLVVGGLGIQHLNHLIQGRWDELPLAYAKYPIVIPVFLALAIIVVLVIRVIGFLGGKNIFHLLIGKYHRPVWERKVFLFLDIKGSTNLVDSLGPEKSKRLFGKFMFDSSEPITDNGGEIYRYQGDGFVATWNWEDAFKPEGVFKAVDDLYLMIDRERDRYNLQFGACPDFRIGIHGGDIITSEEGDIRRNIGFYGDAINIAARMEAKAKDYNVDCVVTSDVADRAVNMGDRIKEVGEEAVRGIDRKIKTFGFNRMDPLSD